MAREHHCPNCGPQACNASTSKIHTCGVCAAIWEEDLSIPTPAPAAPRPTAPAAPTPPRPSTPAAAPAAPAGTSKPPAPTPPPAKPAAPAPAAAAPKPAAPAAPKAAAAPAGPSPAAAAPPAAKPASAPAAGDAKTLAQVLAAAKVKRCPKCQSDSLAAPSDFKVVSGRVVLVDSQTYRGHEWYADTGEVLPSAPPPPIAPAPPAPAGTPPPAPAPRPAA